MPENYDIELGEIELAIRNAIFPIVQFSPAILIDKKNAAKIEMKALDIGFSPLKALINQPSLKVALVSPKLKIIQDLLGPRLADFELITSEDNENSDAIYVLEGEKSYPTVTITSKGLGVDNSHVQDLDIEFRTDNNLTIYNFQAIEQSLKTFSDLVQGGKISQLKIIDASVDMHDSVYGLLREFSDIDLVVSSSISKKKVIAQFKIVLAGRTTIGTIERSVTGEEVILNLNIENLDFSSILPFLDDDRSLFALKGAGNLVANILFDKNNSDIKSALFAVELEGANLRIEKDLFLISASKILIDWFPKLSKFSIRPTDIRIGNSSGKVSADLISGLDKNFGPTLSMSVEAQRVAIYPNDMLAPITPFDKISIIGWSAPLYSALGIDYFVAKKQGVEIRAKARFDMLRSGMGMKMEIGGEGASVDDLKRLWPYFIAGDARDWFVNNVTKGIVKSANMSINFPLGTMPKLGESLPLPKGSINANLIGKDVSVIPIKGMKPIKIDNDVILKMADNILIANIDSANILSNEGKIAVKNGAIILDTENPKSTIYELSGDISGTINALVAFSRKYLPDVLDEENIPLELDALGGDVNGSLVTTLSVNNDGEIENVDYAANGNIDNFVSQNKIAGYKIDKGQFNFLANSRGYSLNGKIGVLDQELQFKLDGVLGDKQDMVLIADLSIADIKKLGFDLSNFMSGKIKIALKIIDNGIWELDADIKNANLNIVDIGISKQRGVAGRFSAKIEQLDSNYQITNSQLTFGDVVIRGDILANSDGLQSANFSTFTLSKGDQARLAIKLVDNAISLVIRGKRMDLKPMLRRAFALDVPSAGAPRSTQSKKRLLLDVELDQAIGFYKTIAQNFDLEMDIKGDDLRHVLLQTQFAGNKAVSISTNQTEGGRTMIVAFSDLGNLLRFVNVYPRLLGGRGSLSMNTNINTNIDNGVIAISDFSIVDEAKVAQILGSYSESRSIIARENRVSFNFAKVEFIRKTGQLEITDALIDGGDIGGTLRGFIYTKERKYDLTGTYIPLFGLNSIFQKLPLFGEILGGREGEGLIGVTFAIRGNLDSPQFIINPASILAPGVFRSLFEFRAREAPREQ